MSILKISIFLLILFHPIFSSNDYCPTSMCGQNSFNIRFPFQLQGHQPQNCGYPGFNLYCNNQGRTVLNLPFSGEFFVRSIDYRAQVIYLYDPNRCLPSRLFQFNLTGSPFVAAYYQNYTFITCPRQVRGFNSLAVIDCLSNSTNTTSATPSLTLATTMVTCEIVATLPVPVASPVEFEDGFFSDFRGDLVLTWGAPDCEVCELTGGVCGFTNGSGGEVSCFSNSGRGTGKGLNIFRIIALSISIPAIICSFLIAFLMCFLDKRRGGNTTRQNNNPSATVAPEIEIENVGLDELTIESYTKVVIGESCRVQGPNHITCPICLSDYHPKETLRTIPECQHSFHSDCIDEWLRINGTCPVCRNTPSPAHDNS